MILQYDVQIHEKDLGKGAVLLDFSSEGCGACDMLAYLFEELDKDLDDKVRIYLVKFEENLDLAEQHDVQAFPSLVMLKDGEEVGRLRGLQRMKDITALIEKGL